MKTKSLFFGMFFAAFAAVGANAQNDGLIEIAQDQGTSYDTFTRCSMTKQTNYTEYTATDHLQVAIKMMGSDVNVKGCDYLVIKFAEAVPAGWNVSVWEGQANQSLKAGITEWKYDIPAEIQASGELPQICILTVYDDCTFPSTIKIAGVYKHKSTSTPVEDLDAADATVVGIYDLTGKKYDELQKGVNIVKMSNGAVKKVVK